jgi:hypothetical protein
MNAVLFSDPHTLDPLGVKQHHEFGLQGRELFSLRLLRTVKGNSGRGLLAWLPVSKGRAEWGE